MSGLKSLSLINSKFYYGVVTAVYMDDTADVAVYADIKPYVAGKKYLKGDLVKLPDDKIYELLETVTLQSNNQTFIEHPSYFAEYDVRNFNINMSNPEKEFKSILPKCNILLSHSNEDTIVNNKVVGSYKYLAVGSPVIVVKLSDANVFAIIAFDKPSQILTDNRLTNAVGYTNDLDYANYFVCWQRRLPIMERITVHDYDVYINLAHNHIDSFGVYDSTWNRLYTRDSIDFVINRKIGAFKILSSSGIDLNHELYAYYNYGAGGRYPTLFSMNNGHISVNYWNKDFYTFMDDYCFFRVFGLDAPASRLVEYVIVPFKCFFYSFNGNQISNLGGDALLPSKPLVSMDYNRYGKYLFSQQAFSPFSQATELVIDHIMLCSIHFFIRDRVTNLLYFIKCDLYNNRVLYVCYTQFDNNYPVCGHFGYVNADSVHITSYNLSELLPDYLSFNHMGDLGVGYTYNGDSCSSFSIFFGLVDFYPSMFNGTFNLSYNYNGGDGSWSGSSYYGTASFNIEDNEETFPYLKRFDNTYTVFGRTMREFYDIDENEIGLEHQNNSWKLFRFTRKGYIYNSSLPLPSIFYRNYANGLNHFPFSLRKAVYIVTLDEDTDRITIDNLDPDLPDSGQILLNWNILGDVYMSVDDKVVDYTKLNPTTLKLNRELSSGEYIISFYLLYFFDVRIALLTYFREGDTTYHNIEDAYVASKITYFDRGVLGILYFFRETNIYWQSGFYAPAIIEQFAYCYDNGNIYNIKNSLDNSFGSDYSRIVRIDFFNTGLLTNFIENYYRKSGYMENNLGG